MKIKMKKSNSFAGLTIFKKLTLNKSKFHHIISNKLWTIENFNWANTNGL